MAGRKPLSPSQLAARRKKVADFYLTGESQMEIAKLVGASQKTVSRDLEYWQTVWEKSTVLEIHRAKLRELQRIDRLEVTAWKAWGRSCLDAVTMHAEKTQGRTDKKGKPLPDLTKSSKTTKGQAGDPRFLERVSWCIQKRCEILRILKAEDSVPPPPPPVNVNVDVGTQLAPYARAIASLVGGRLGQPRAAVSSDGAVQSVDEAEANGTAGQLPPVSRN